MPKRTDIKSILIIGAGPIIIGQACEFDYSGTQACKALKEEGYRVILINSNPATIMTDPDLADATYIEPITPEIIEQIIEKERPDALLPTMGGQTALNTALSLERSGVLKRYNVEMIGANADTIDKAEDRALFREAVKRIGLETPRSILANATEIKEEERKKNKENLLQLKSQGNESSFLAQEEKKQKEKDQKQRYINHAVAIAARALDEIGLPAIIRPSFTLGGSGGGIAYNQAEFFEIVSSGLAASPTTEVLIEECLFGCKEYEMEVVRDSADNCIVVCSIENIDPMGVHTGDSITVAPALTLTDKEYQIMRNAALAVVREIGIETGGANVQFSVNPSTGKLVVIEMNPRVSRSSALASKATGFPIARIAAKLAVGYTLDELENDITQGAIPASFEPSIDYVVTKIPRFAFEKFPEVKPILGTSMQSVGEVMAIGRTFQESLQKALRSLETGLSGFDEIDIPDLGMADDRDAINAALGVPSPDRLRLIAQAMRMNVEKEQIHSLCKIDPWFLDQIHEIILTEKRISTHGLPEDAENFHKLKAMGFSDVRLAYLANTTTKTIREKRESFNIHPVYKRIDTCAGEFFSPTAYMYSTYETASFLTSPSSEADPSKKEKIIILGGGPNRIGQGIEFDYCCVHASLALREKGYESIIINCNPETVSTDYDSSNRLYFEPLTEEDITEIIRTEKEAGTLHGVIVQFGGQTPLKLAKTLEEEGIPILGTAWDGIDRAEDRNRFQNLLKSLNLSQPKNEIAYSIEQARKKAEQLGFPLIARPSYVLGGRAMRIIENNQQLESWLTSQLSLLASEKIASVSSNIIEHINSLLEKTPLLFDACLINAIEVDVDCLCDGEEVYVAGIMQHIEETGIHSGDSACSLPPYSLNEHQIKELERQTIALARELKSIGLMNVQFAIEKEKIYVLEVNARASRTAPFVAKAIGRPLPAIATRIMTGENLQEALSYYGGKVNLANIKHVAVKEAVFPFSRFPATDTLLGPEMKSTGEVMGIDRNFPLAFAKSQLASGLELPRSGTVFVSVRDSDKKEILPVIKLLESLGFKILATSGTAQFLLNHNVQVEKINKVMEGHPHIEDAIHNGKIHLVFNTTKGEKSIADSRSLRRATLTQKVPYYTTLAGACTAGQSIAALRNTPTEVFRIQDYINTINSL